MTENRRGAINHYAQELLKVLEVKIPIDIDEVTTKLGGKINRVIDISEGAMKDGRLKVDGETFEITLNTYENTEERLRFSFAHELGHLFLHMGKEGSDVKNSVYYRYGGGIEEEEANEFAAAFLMPEDKFKEIAEKEKEDECYLIYPIAEYFRVSKEAVIVRGKKLNLWR